MYRYSIVVLLSLLSSYSVWAGIQLDFVVDYNEHEIVHTCVVNENSKAVWQAEDLAIEAVPSIDGNEVAIELVIYQCIENMQVPLTKSLFKTVWGQQVELVSTNDSNEELTIKLTASCDDKS